MNNKSSLFKISNILWDKTDDDGSPVEADWLPHTVVIQSTDAEIGFPENVSMNEAEDLISDWLSEKYGFCHNGFTLEEIEEL